MARKSRSRGRSSGGVRAGEILVGGIVYGIARNKISSMLKNSLGGVVGNMSDEVIMGIVSYLAAEKGSGMIRDAGKVGLGIEASRFSQNLNIGGLLGSTSTENTTQSTSSGATW